MQSSLWQPGLGFHAEYSYMTQRLGLWMSESHGNEKALATNFMLQTCESLGDQKPGAFINLQDNEATRLMDALWACGVRPTNNIDANPVIAAKDAHIEDLRKVAFK